jgi:cell division protein FtsL
MKLFGFVERRVRGFRVVDLTALAVVLALALVVYAFKTSASHQTAEIADAESQIRAESQHIRLLQAEIAHLESPDRIERLAARYLGAAPVAARQEIAPADLPKVAAAEPAPPREARP